MNTDEKKLVEKYYKTVTKQKDITEIVRINDASFRFNYDGIYFIIAYDKSSECMIISECGPKKVSVIDTDTAREISLDDIKELQF